MRVVPILAVAWLILSVTAAEGQTGPATQDMRTQWLICLARIEGNPRYARIYEKLSVATATDLGRMPTPRQLSDNEVISDADIALGLEWYARVRTCTAPVNQALGGVDPKIQSYLAASQVDTKNIIDDIVSKQIRTFAQANARLSVIKEHQQILDAKLAPIITPDYQSQLSNWLETHKVYPETARQAGEQGRVVLRFRVDRTGRVLEHAVVGSSGYPDLDAAADSMMSGARLPAFPPTMTQPKVEVSVTIRYGLYVP